MDTKWDNSIGNPSFRGIWPLLPDTISVTGVTSDTPHIAIGGPNKTAVATWHGFNTIDTVYAVSKNLGGLNIWGTVQTISPATISSANPRVAVGPAGNALVSFFEFVLKDANEYSAVGLSAAFIPYGGVARISATIEGIGIVNPANLSSSLVVDSSGNALATWTSSIDGANFSLNSVVLQSNGTLSELVELYSDLYIFEQDLMVDSVGNAFLAFMSTNPSNPSSLVIQTEEISMILFHPILGIIRP